MAAKRRRAQHRRGRFRGLYQLLSFLLIVAAIVAGCIVFFKVEEITVVGSTTYSDQEIIAASGISCGDNLILTRRISAGKQLISTLPYLKSANIRWSLPNGLVITVSECTPVGVLADEDGLYWLMDATGKLLECGGESWASQYPLIVGLTPVLPGVGKSLEVSEEEQSKLDSLLEFLSALEQADALSQVTSLDVSGASVLTMGYGERFTVRLPLYSEEYTRQVGYLLLIVSSDALSQGQEGTIDMTVDTDNEVGRFIPYSS